MKLEIKKIETMAELDELVQSGNLHGLYDMPDTLYHTVNAASCTSLGWISRAPAVWKMRQTISLDTDAIHIGSSFDCLIFTPDEWKNKFAVGPDVKTKADKEWKAFVSANPDRYCFKPAEINEQIAMSTALRKNHGINKLLCKGHAQVSCFYQLESGHILKARADFLSPVDIGRPDIEQWEICDLKTCADGKAHPDEFAKHAFNYRYHCQDAWYQYLFGQFIKVHGFTFIVIEKSAPYLNSILKLDKEARELGYNTIMADLAEYMRIFSNPELQENGYTNCDVTQTVYFPKWCFNGARPALETF